LGKAALGSYTFAWTLAGEPVKQISALVGRVTPAVFSAVQTDYAALRRYLLSLTEALSLVTFPAAFGLALVAEEFVPLAMGPKWLAVIAPLRLLALYASFRSISMLFSHILNVIGESRFCMRNGLLAVVLLPTAFYVGSNWGTVGIAVAWMVVHPLVTLPIYWRVLRKIDLSVGRYLQSLWPALSGSLWMVVAVWATREILPSIWPLPLRFALQVLGGGAAYILTLTALHRERFYAFRQVLKKVRG
jgi:O-antigen/teichoic acid export membrane protein